MLVSPQLDRIGGRLSLQLTVSEDLVLVGNALVGFRGSLVAVGHALIGVGGRLIGVGGRLI
jgi:hypothetical protein